MSGPGGAKADIEMEWPIKSSPIHLFDGVEAARNTGVKTAGAAYSARSRGGRVAGSPQLRVAPWHLLADGVLGGAELFCLSWTDMNAAPEVPAAWQIEDGAWLLHAACQEAQAWRAAAPGALGLADIDLRALVVLPALRGDTACVTRRVRAALDSASLPAGLLDVALDAGDLHHDGAELPLLAAALRDLGVGVVVDGLQDVPGSLSALRRLPLTGVRLHASLVQGMEICADRRGRVERAIRLAHALGARVVALGVQTHLQRDILADLGCDEAQGAAFAPVLRAEVFRAALVDEGLLF